MAKLSRIGPFLGLNNRLPDHSLHVPGTRGPVGDFLRNAVNVDLTDRGTLQRREGVTAVVAGTDVHSLWADEGGAFYVDGDTLYAYPRTAVRAGLSPQMRVSYARTFDGVIWSNGAVLERIVVGASSRLGLAVPNPAPVVSAESGGALPPGYYQVAVTAVAASGEESGATWPVQVEVTAGGHIQIAGLPGALTAIYLSPPNGDLLYRVATTSAATFTIADRTGFGPQLAALGVAPMPPGHIVRTYNGRLLVAAGDVLNISEPFAYGLHNPMKGFVQFPGRITVVQPVESGVFVCADKTYFLAGANPADPAALRELLPYGAVEGTGGFSPRTEEAFWFSTKGLVMGGQDGTVKNVQEEAVAVGRAALGAQLYRDQNGVRQVVSSLFGAEPSTAAATSYMDAEIVRKGEML